MLRLWNPRESCSRYLGERLPTLRLRKGDREGRALQVCCALRCSWLALTLTSRAKTIVRLLGGLASNFMQNVLLEEFMLREILQTRLRLRLLAGPDRARYPCRLGRGLSGHTSDMLRVHGLCAISSIVNASARAIRRDRSWSLLYRPLNAVPGPMAIVPSSSFSQSPRRIW